MPNGDEQWTPFAAVYSETALRAQEVLPDNLRGAVLRAVNELLKNPIRPPHTTPIDRSGRIYLYRQPDPPLEITYEIDSEESRIYFMHFTTSTLGIGGKKSVVVSYHDDDKDILAKLMRFLNPLKKEYIDVWQVEDIAPSENRKRVIQDRLDSADMALLLVSQSFIDGALLDDELQLEELLGLAKEKGVRILWIAVGPSTYRDTDIDVYEPLGDRDRPLRNIAENELDAKLLQIYEEIKALVQNT